MRRTRTGTRTAPPTSPTRWTRSLILSVDLCKRGFMDPGNPLPRSPTERDPDLYTLQDLILDTYCKGPLAEQLYRAYTGME